MDKMTEKRINEILPNSRWEETIDLNSNGIKSLEFSSNGFLRIDNGEVKEYKIVHENNTFWISYYPHIISDRFKILQIENDDTIFLKSGILHSLKRV